MSGQWALEKPHILFPVSPAAPFVISLLLLSQELLLFAVSHSLSLHVYVCVIDQLYTSLSFISSLAHLTHTHITRRPLASVLLTLPVSHWGSFILFLSPSTHPPPLCNVGTSKALKYPNSYSKGFWIASNRMQWTSIEYF